MKKKFKQYNIVDPIYRAPLCVFTGNIDLIKKHLIKCGFPDYGEVQDAKFVPHNGMRAIILRDKSTTTLAHELVHYVFNVFDSRNIPISLENDEAFAYYFEMTLENVLKALKK